MPSTRLLRRIATPRPTSPPFKLKVNSKNLMAWIGIVSLLPFLIAFLDLVRSTPESNTFHVRGTPEPADDKNINQPYFEPFSTCTEPSIMAFCTVNIFANYFADTVISNTKYEGAPESYEVYAQFLNRFRQDADAPHFIAVRDQYLKDYPHQTDADFYQQIDRIITPFNQAVGYLGNYTRVRDYDPEKSALKRSQMVGMKEDLEFIKTQDTTSGSIQDISKLGDPFRTFLKWLKDNRIAIELPGEKLWIPDSSGVQWVFEKWVNTVSNLPDTQKADLLKLSPKLDAHFARHPRYTQLIDTISQAIHQLNLGEKRIIPSGWVGHSMALGIEKTTESQILLTILNGGLRIYDEKIEPSTIDFGTPLLSVSRPILVPQNRLIENLAVILNAKIYTNNSDQGTRRVYNHLNGLLYWYPSEIHQLPQTLDVCGFAGTCNKDAPQLSLGFLTDFKPYGRLLDLTLRVEWYLSLASLSEIPSEVLTTAQHTLLTEAKELRESGILPSAAYLELHQLIGEQNQGLTDTRDYPNLQTPQGSLPEIGLSRITEQIIALFSSKNSDSVTEKATDIRDLKSRWADYLTHPNMTARLKNVGQSGLINFEFSDPLDERPRIAASASWSEFETAISTIQAFNDRLTKKNKDASMIRGLVFGPQLGPPWMPKTFNGDSISGDTYWRFGDSKAHNVERAIFQSVIDQCHLSSVLSSIIQGQTDITPLEVQNFIALLDPVYLKGLLPSGKINHDELVRRIKLLVIADGLIRRSDPIYDQTRFELPHLQTSDFDSLIADVTLTDVRLTQDIHAVRHYIRSHADRPYASFYSRPYDFKNSAITISTQEIETAPFNVPELLYANRNTGQSSLDSLEAFYKSNHSVVQLIYFANSIRQVLSFDKRQKFAIVSGIDLRSVPFPDSYKLVSENDPTETGYEAVAKQLPHYQGTGLGLDNAITTDLSPLKLADPVKFRRSPDTVIPNRVKRDYFRIYQPGLVLTEGIHFFTQYPQPMRHPTAFNNLLNQLRALIPHSTGPLPAVVENLAQMTRPDIFIDQFIQYLGDERHSPFHVESGITLLNLMMDGLTTARSMDLISEDTTPVDLNRASVKLLAAIKNRLHQTPTETPFQALCNAYVRLASNIPTPPVEISDIAIHWVANTDLNFVSPAIQDAMAAIIAQPSNALIEVLAQFPMYSEFAQYTSNSWELKWDGIPFWNSENARLYFDPRIWVEKKEGDTRSLHSVLDRLGIDKSHYRDQPLPVGISVIDEGLSIVVQDRLGNYFAKIGPQENGSLQYRYTPTESNPNNLVALHGFGDAFTPTLAPTIIHTIKELFPMPLTGQVIYAEFSDNTINQILIRFQDTHGYYGGQDFDVKVVGNNGDPHILLTPGPNGGEIIVLPQGHPDMSAFPRILVEKLMNPLLIRDAGQLKLWDRPEPTPKAETLVFVKDGDQIVCNLFPKLPVILQPTVPQPLTIRHFILGDGKTHRLLIPFTASNHVHNDLQRLLLTFELDEQLQNPIGTPAAMLLLSAVYYQDGAYSDAAKLLDRIVLLGPLSIDESDTFSNAIRGKNVGANVGANASPNAKAVRIRLCLFEYKNLIQDPAKLADYLSQTSGKMEITTFQYLLTTYFRGLRAHKVDADCQLSVQQLHDFIWIGKYIEGFNLDKLNPVMAVIGDPSLWQWGQRSLFKSTPNATLNQLKPQNEMIPIQTVGDPYSGNYASLIAAQESPRTTTLPKQALHPQTPNTLYTLRLRGHSQEMETYLSVPRRMFQILHAPGKLRTVLQQEIPYQEAQIRDSRQIIDSIQLATDFPVTRADVSSGQITLAKFSELILAFISGTADRYQVVLPASVHGAINELHQALAHYLTHSVALRNAESALRAVNNGQDVSSVGEQLISRRIYALNHLTDRAMLAYNFLSQMTGKANQITAITELLSGNKIVVQLRTGAGKSSYILPTMALHYAGQHQTFGVYVPPKLLTSTATRLSESIAASNVQVHTFHFQRSYPHAKTIPALTIQYEMLLNQLRAITSTGSPVVMASTTHHSLVAKLVEMRDLALANPTPEIQAILKLCISMVDTVRSIPSITDEYDDVNSFRDEFNYAIRRAKKIDAAEVDTALFILRTWHSSPRIATIIDQAPVGVFEKRRLPSGNHYVQLIETKSPYFQTVLNAMVDEALDDIYAQHGHLLPTMVRPDLHLFIMGGRRDRPENQRLETLIQSIESEQPAVARSIMVFKNYLSAYLPHILSKNPHTDYAPVPQVDEPGRALSRPYSQGNPKGSSTFFQTPGISILATAQYFHLFGPSKASFKQLMLDWISEAKSDSTYSRTFNELSELLSPIMNRGEWVGTNDIFQLDLNKEETVDQLQQELQRHPKVWRRLVSTIVQNELVQYPSKIVVPPLSIPGNGMSATHEFSMCYAHGTVVKADPMIGVSDAVILNPDSQTIEVIDSTSPSAIYELIVQHVENGADSYLDGANYLSHSMSEILDALESRFVKTAHRPQFFVYVSESGAFEMKEFGQRQAAPYSPSRLLGKQLFYFLRQKDGRGTDFPLTRMVMSVDIKSPEDFKQNYGRNRATFNVEEFGPNPAAPPPKTTWIISKSLAVAAAEKLGIEPETLTTKHQIKTWIDLLGAERDVDVVVKGFTTQLESIVYPRALDTLMSVNAASELVQTALTFFIKDTSFSPNAQLISAVSPADYFDGEARRILSQYASILTPEDRQTICSLAQYAGRFEGFGDHILTPISNLDHSVAVETDMATDQDESADTLRDQQVDTDQSREFSDHIHVETKWDMTPLIHAGDTSAHHNVRDQLRPWITLPVDIWVSPEFVITHDSQKKLPESVRSLFVNPDPSWTQHTKLTTAERAYFKQRAYGITKSIHWFLIMQDPQKKPIIIGLTSAEADRARELIRTAPQSVALMYADTLPTEPQPLTPVVSSPTFSSESIAPNASLAITQTIRFLNCQMGQFLKSSETATYLHSDNPKKTEQLITALESATFSMVDSQVKLRTINRLSSSSRQELHCCAAHLRAPEFEGEHHRCEPSIKKPTWARLWYWYD